MIKIVSNKIERKKNFFQSKYKNKDKQIYILLHYCREGVLLDKHKHKMLQFGYNFYGKYEFKIDNNLVYIKNEDTYIINENIEHEAEAITDYYSIDIKFYGKMNIDMIINQPLTYENPLELKTNNGIILVKKIINSGKINKNSYLVPSKKIIINGFLLEPMNIYNISCDVEIDNINGELIVIEIK